MKSRRGTGVHGASSALAGVACAIVRVVRDSCGFDWSADATGSAIKLSVSRLSPFQGTQCPK